MTEERRTHATEMLQLQYSNEQLDQLSEDLLDWIPIVIEEKLRRYEQEYE